MISADSLSVEQFDDLVGKSRNIVIHLVVDHKLTKLFVVGDIRGDHHAVQTVGHVDEILHGQPVLKFAEVAAMQEHAAECRQLVIRQSIHTGGEEVEFVHRRRIQSGIRQFGERVGAGNDDFADGEVSQPVSRVGDFAARSRKFQRGVKQISRRRLRGQFDGCLKIVCHNCLTLPFCYNAVLGIDLFDVCHDVGENRHDNAVSRQFV